VCVDACKAWATLWSAIVLEGAVLAFTIEVAAGETEIHEKDALNCTVQRADHQVGRLQVTVHPAAVVHLLKNVEGLLDHFQSVRKSDAMRVQVEHVLNAGTQAAHRHEEEIRLFPVIQQGWNAI
jgi:hypothetical protein